jgi:hypothetical protein
VVLSLEQQLPRCDNETRGWGLGQQSIGLERRAISCKQASPLRLGLELGGIGFAVAGQFGTGRQVRSSGVPHRRHAVLCMANPNLPFAFWHALLEAMDEAERGCTRLHEAEGRDVCLAEGQLATTRPTA